METYDDLKREFDEKVKELQERCNHPETGWAKEEWALAHGTGKAVKYCKVCNKILEKIPLKEAYERGYLERRPIPKVVKLGE